MSADSKSKTRNYGAVSGENVAKTALGRGLNLVTTPLSRSLGDPPIVFSLPLRNVVVAASIAAVRLNIG
jgi:hypothetical protein